MNAAGILALLVLAGVVPKMPQIGAQIDQGVTALRAGVDSEAEKVFAQAVDDARSADDNASEARALFYLGVLSHRQAEVLADRSRAATLYEQARDYYLRSLEKYPSSTATLMNLADTQEALGNRSGLQNALERGYALPGTRHDYFAARLAVVRARDGAIEDALKYFDTIESSTSLPAGVERNVIDAFLAADMPNEQFITVLWRLLPTASTDDVLLGAFGAFRKGGMRAEAVDALFGVVAAAWARQNYSQQQLAELGILQEFVALKQNTAYRPRAEALDAVLHSNLEKRDLFFEWPERLGDAFPRDLSPRLALADYSSSIGRRLVAERDLTKAEAHFVLARGLGRTDDLQLAGDLAGVYVVQRRLADLQKLTRELDAALYAEGGSAQFMDPGALYEFHLRLGTYHTLLEPPRSVNPTMSAATDQLQKAVRAAERLSEKLAAEGKPAFVVDPVVLRLLERSKSRLNPEASKR